MHYRINAGFLPANHWINDPEQGGGRIIGEVCHFVDFLSFLSNSVPVVVDTQSVGCPDPSFVITVCFADGSHGTISYLTAGDRSYSKERLEVFGAGCTAVLEDFRSLELIRNGRRTTMRSRLFQDKGHRAEWHAFANAIRRGEESPISFESIVISTLASLRAMTSRAAQAPMSVNLETLNVATNSVDDNQTISGALKLETC
jgi:predicted dehydrogenase